MGVAGLSAAYGGAVAGAVFHFKSPAGIAVMSFTVAGAGLGGKGGEFGGGYGAIEVEQPFSIDDLDGSTGGYATIGAGLLIGYSVTLISAYGSLGSMFTNQNVGGFCLSAGVGGLAGVGYWKCLGDY